MTSPSEKLKEMKENLNRRKLDIIQTFAEQEEVNHPQILVGMVWELRSIVKTLKWLNDENEEEKKFRSYAG